jgi:hypothetical protein
MRKMKMAYVVDVSVKDVMWCAQCPFQRLERREDAYVAECLRSNGKVIATRAIVGDKTKRQIPVSRAKVSKTGEYTELPQGYDEVPDYTTRQFREGLDTLMDILWKSEIPEWCPLPNLKRKSTIKGFWGRCVSREKEMSTEEKIYKILEKM